MILSLLATVKICILGLGIDEEYAVTMAYRITGGDRMFLEMWEPHQTSGFLSAFLTELFVRLTGGTESLILYLRVSGACIQALISLFLYRTLRRSFSEEAAFVASVFFFNTLPKWIQTPEFSNMLVWFSTLAFVCFLRYYLSDHKQLRWLVAAGVSLSAMVLSYPSCVLAMPLILLGMWKLKGSRSFLREASVLLGTCSVLGLGYIGYFLGYMRVGEFFHGLGQMMTDGSHDMNSMLSITFYGKEMIRLLGFAAAAVLPTALPVLAVKKLRTIRSVLLLVMIASLLQQLVYWLTDSIYLQEPLLYFYFLLLCGVLLYLHGRKEKEENFAKRTLFWMGSIAAAGIWFSALLITNTTISVTGSYLMPGLISGILFLWDDVRKWGQKHLLRGFALSLLGITLFAKGFLVCSTEGVKDNVLLVRQKALSGPAKGIYCRYMDGYAYNVVAELLAEYTSEECPVLYVGKHSLYYLLGSQTIANYSTISTPTYDERLGEYWNLYPDRTPKLVLCDTDEYSLQKIKELLELGPLIAERELLEDLHSVRIYEVSGRRE